MAEVTERDRELATEALGGRSSRLWLLVVRTLAQAREEGRIEMRRKGEWRDGYLAGSRRAILGMQDLISELVKGAEAFTPKESKDA